MNEADSELTKRLKKAIIDDLTTNRKPEPKTVPAFAIAFDPQTMLIRIAHARQFDFQVALVYIRVCDLKGQLAKIMAAEIAIEAQLSEDYGRAMGGLDPVRFDG
jgi:hypothetical protein